MFVNIQSTLDKDVYLPGDIVNASIVLHIEKDCILRSLYQSMRGEEVFQTNGGKNMHGNNVLFENSSEKVVDEIYKAKSMIKIPLKCELPMDYGSTFTVEDCGFSYSYKVYICVQVEYRRVGKPSSGIYKTNKHIELKVQNKKRQCLKIGSKICHVPFKVSFLTKIPLMKEKKKMCMIHIDSGSSFELGGRVQFSVLLDTLHLKKLKVEYIQDVVFKMFDSGDVTNKLSQKVTECHRIIGNEGNMRFTLDIPTDIVDKNYSNIYSHCISVKNYMRFTPIYYSVIKLVSPGEHVFSF